jgi:predicted transcriptional regulator with HTH domain
LANTEINYVKKKVAKLETDFAAFASLLIQAGIVEVVDKDGEQVFKVNKVKLDG